MKIRSNDRGILSIQVCYGGIWSNNEGNTAGRPLDMHLSFGEGLVQVNGRFGNTVEYLAFRTNMGHVFAFGPNSGLGLPFTAEPSHPNTVLRFISGRDPGTYRKDGQCSLKYICSAHPVDVVGRRNNLEEQGEEMQPGQ
ncbi:zymogen granule membrane protein 16-like [Notechis scutatus]|uniref:Zymogen granule membrane protein 16-like n=1 Tax=Notechis scutatus TaxID=8663 RepID=A0A6J1VDZ8_9SAUR|nr:zymogen granule membrane protein 16-like [Notechis scutatus]